MLDFLEIFLKKEIIGPILTILVAYILYVLIRILLEKSLKKNKSDFDRKRKRTVVELIKSIIKVFLVVICIIVVLDLFGIDVTSIVASLGVASAVGALSLQDTLKDIISGASIIMDNYFVVGDTIELNDFKGQVIELGLKSTKIMSVNGEVKIVANRNITEVTNLSQKTASNLIIAPPAYEEKTEKVEKILKEIVDEVSNWETIDKEKTSYIGIIELSPSSVDYGIRIYCSPGKVWEYRREILKMIKNKYDKNKIKIPYNQLEID